MSGRFDFFCVWLLWYLSGRFNFFSVTRYEQFHTLNNFDVIKIIQVLKYWKYRAERAFFCLADLNCFLSHVMNTRSYLKTCLKTLMLQNYSSFKMSKISPWEGFILNLTLRVRIYDVVMLHVIIMIHAWQIWIVFCHTFWTLYHFEHMF